VNKTKTEPRFWADTTEKTKELAPAVYRNWLAYMEQRPCHGIDEYAVLSDGRITGELNHRDPGRADGPYEVINVVPNNTEQSTQIRLVLRIHRYLAPSPLVPNSENLSREYVEGGGLHEDEFVALLSLCIGIPLRCGGQMRIFYSGESPEGRPCAFDVHSLPERPRGAHHSRMIPSPEEVNLSLATQFLSAFPNLEPSQAAALVRAARLYRDALWYSDSMPDMSWLMLVNAVETASQHYGSKMAQDSVWDNGLGKDLYPCIEKLHPSDEQLSDIAAVIAKSSGVLAKVRSFILSHLPPEPLLRPEIKYQVPWDSKSLLKIFGNIYDLRSKAVHEGKQFPSELCRPAEIIGGVYAEYSPPYERHPKSTLMRLHGFAYLVQQAILQWWLEAGTTTTDETTKSHA